MHIKNLSCHHVQHTGTSGSLKVQAEVGREVGKRGNTALWQFMSEMVGDDTGLKGRSFSAVSGLLCN